MAIAVREALRDLAGANSGKAWSSRRLGWSPVPRPAASAAIDADGALWLAPESWGGGSAGPDDRDRGRGDRSGRWERMKTCRNSSCRWAFYDATRDRWAVWCDMAACGSRAKSRRTTHGSARRICIQPDPAAGGRTRPAPTNPPSPWLEPIDGLPQERIHLVTREHGVVLVRPFMRSSLAVLFSAVRRMSWRGAGALGGALGGSDPGRCDHVDLAARADAPGQPLERAAAGGDRPARDADGGHAVEEGDLGASSLSARPPDLGQRRGADAALRHHRHPRQRPAGPCWACAACPIRA